MLSDWADSIPISGKSILPLQHRGRLVEISAPVKERRVCFDLLDFYHQEARLFGVDSRSLDASACADILRQLNPGFETKALQDAIAAYEQVLNRTAKGKVVLTPKHD